MKRLLAISLAFVLAFFVLSDSNAEDPSWYAPGPHSNRTLEFKNIREGFALFRSVCKNCHARGDSQNDNFLCPDSKTMKGWNRVFARGNSVVENNSCLEGLTDEELRDLSDYLYSHASDADNPYDELECNL